MDFDFPMKKVMDVILEIIVVLTVSALLLLALFQSFGFTTGVNTVDEFRRELFKYYGPLQRFFRDGLRFMRRTTKPTKKEFTEICIAIGIGFALLGGIGFMVKLIHIPINHIIVA